MRRVEERILAVVPAVGRRSAPESELPFTPRAVASLERTLTEALALGHNYIGTEHLLLGLFGDTGSAGRESAQRLGREPRPRSATQVIEKLSGYVKPPT